MKIQIILATVCSLIMSGCAVNSAEHSELKAFPVAKEGMTRFVISLPHKERGEEDNFMVEIITGKNMLTDGINLVRLANTIETRSLKGWGYSYFEVSGNSSSAISTLMATPENLPKVTTFVTAPSIKVPYNSRIPLVIYTPEDYEVQYRIWQASSQIEQAKK